MFLKELVEPSDGIRSELISLYTCCAVTIIDSLYYTWIELSGFLFHVFFLV